MRLLVVAIVAIVVAVQANDHCNIYPTCTLCVASPFCGWCSTPVQYQNSSGPSFQCAGFNQNGSNPFVCNGIYSTKVCTRGWQCDTQNYTCVLSTPGGGEPLDMCQANCSTTGKTFICNNQTKQCELAPAGQGESFAACQASCSSTTAPSSSSPSSSSPSSESPSSSSPSSESPSSESPSSQAPSPTPAPTYMCNSTTFKCDLAQAGQGSSLPVCEAGCKPSNNTPSALLGLWRVFSISNDAPQPVREYDLNFTETTAQIATSNWTSICDVTAIGTNIIWLTNCTGPERPLKCIWETTLTMPETYHAMMACNFNGGDAPASFAAAMQAGYAGGDDTIFMSQCVPDGFCSFHFGLTARKPRDFVFQNVVQVAQSTPPPDPCTNYGANCTFCLSHQYCGWCSANVIYTDGTVGTQCAGFNPDPKKRDPFTCTGTYSTEMCLPGFICEPQNSTCVPTLPGGGTPKSSCAASCKSKPGPPSVLIGNWRGLAIQNNYSFGVIELNITATNITAYFNGALDFQGYMSNLGGDIFITFSNGPQQGDTISGIYTIQQNEIVQYIEVAFGGANAGLPSSYKTAMRVPGSEAVLAKCASANCNW